jgi:hypothetical protein
MVDLALCMWSSEIVSLIRNKSVANSHAAD